MSRLPWMLTILFLSALASTQAQTNRSPGDSAPVPGSVESSSTRSEGATDAPGWRPGSVYSGVDRDAFENRPYSRPWTGVVSNPTANLDRNLGVQFDIGQERTVEVPRNAKIRRGSRGISIHDVNKGEHVRVSIDENAFRRNGRWRATLVEVIAGADSDSEGRLAFTRLSGSVLDVNENADLFHAQVQGRRLTVYADGADIADRTRSRRLRDLRDGDTVQVEGYRDGDRLYATRVRLD